MACTVTNLKNASCVCTRRRVMGSGSMISMMRLLLSLSEASTRRNALVLSCASRLAIVAYDAALKMKKPSAATRGHETSGRMPQKSRSRLPRVITAEPSQAIASRTVPKLPLRVARRVRPVLTTLVSESHHHVTVPGRRVVRRPRAPAAGMGGGSPQKGSVIRMITITGLFHPARHGTPALAPCTAAGLGAGGDAGIEVGNLKLARFLRTLSRLLTFIGCCCTMAATG